MKRALLLVDVQNDFLPGGALAVPHGDEILEPVCHLLELQAFDLVIASKDWHPQHHVSFATTHGRNIGDIITVHGQEHVLWPVHCVRDTEGAKLASCIPQEKIDAVVEKGCDPTIDSYSAFFDHQKHVATPLDFLLGEKGIEEVYIAGLATEYCVKATALDALELGYHVTLFTDAVRGVNLLESDAIETLSLLEQQGAQLTTTKEWLTKTL